VVADTAAVSFGAMALDGSASHNNLLAAFAREAEVGNRLQWFAELADVEGQPELASAFRTIAEASMGRAFGVLEFLHDGGGAAAGHLVDVLAEQHAAHSEYARAGEQAASEGLEDVSEWFEQMAKARARHITKLES